MSEDCCAGRGTAGAAVGASAAGCAGVAIGVACPLGPVWCTPEVEAKVEDTGMSLVLVVGLYRAGLAAAVVVAAAGPVAEADAACLGTNLGLLRAPAYVVVVGHLL